MAPGIGNIILPTVSIQPTKQPLPRRQTTLYHHSQVTTDSDALQFEAAASEQLKLRDGTSSDTQSSEETLLITSPYNSPTHLLDLTTLDTANQLFAKALTIFTPIRPGYATAPYLESFNWTAVFSFLRELSQAEEYHFPRTSFYVVAFRSKLFPDTDGGRLGLLDDHSHREATESGGLLKYWFGSKDGEHRNLATCLWRSREDARNGGIGPWHQKARAAGREMYESIDFKTMELVVEDGVSGWEMKDWS